MSLFSLPSLSVVFCTNSEGLRHPRFELEPPPCSRSLGAASCRCRACAEKPGEGALLSGSPSLSRGSHRILPALSQCWATQTRANPGWGWVPAPLPGCPGGESDTMVCLGEGLGEPHSCSCFCLPVLQQHGFVLHLLTFEPPKNLNWLKTVKQS